MYGELLQFAEWASGTQHDSFRAVVRQTKYLSTGQPVMQREPLHRLSLWYVFSLACKFHDVKAPIDTREPDMP